MAALELWEQGGNQVGWRGRTCQQFIPDLARYAELVFELRPPWVVEVGAAEGGTADWLGTCMRLAGRPAAVYAVDPLPPTMPGGGRFTWIGADSLAAARQLAPRPRGLVLLDGDHRAATVLAELEAYADRALYLVVEDTIMADLPRYGWGPHEALAEWLPRHPEFRPDPDPVLTQHPGGWLRRVSG